MRQIRAVAGCNRAPGLGFAAGATVSRASAEPSRQMARHLRREVYYTPRGESAETRAERLEMVNRHDAAAGG